MKRSGEEEENRRSEKGIEIGVLDREREIGSGGKRTSDGELTHWRTEGSFPARGEPADEGFVVEVSRRESGGVDPAEWVVEGEKRREAEEAGDGGNELRIGGRLGGLVGESGRGDESDVAEEETVDVCRGGWEALDHGGESGAWYC